MFCVWLAGPMIFAYADPPYVGQAAKHYEGVEVNHRLLIGTLVRDYPDGWALSASSGSLRDLLPMCPEDVRVLAWVKGWASWKPNVWPAYAWEPVIFRGGRGVDRQMNTPRDWVMASASTGKGLAGAKPRQFCTWLFECFNAQPGDELHDLFPGTGAVTRAWADYTPQPSLL